MSERKGKLPRQPYPVKNLAEFKRLIKPGTGFVTTQHANHPGMVGLVRVVGNVQTNGFYSTIKDHPESPYSCWNGRKGIWTAFGKASDYRFEDNCVKMLDRRDSTGQSVLCSFEVFGIPQNLDVSDQPNEEPDEEPVMTL